MALNATTLGQALIAAAGTNAKDAAGQAVWMAVAQAIVTHFQSNATVVPTLLVAPNGGGPVTGTGTVT